MMTFKILGGVIIIISSSLIGHSLSNQYVYRWRNLRHLQSCIQILESEMLYRSMPLPNALESVSNKGNKPIASIFYDIKESLMLNKNSSVLQSFKIHANKLRNECYLNKTDIEIFLSLGSILGGSIKRDQKNHISAILKQLEKQEKEAEEAKKRNEPFYKKLGFLSGLVITIVLF